jgi:phosphoribosyl 1,2-cyclic phosphodiesterase
MAVLGSGSGGNALVVESGGRRLLLDAGFSCRTLERGLRDLGESAAAVDAILLTHEHDDHVRGADLLAKRHGIPVYATAGTLAHARLSEDTRASAVVIRSGEPFEAAGFFVEAFRLPHDAHEPVGFVIEDCRGLRLGAAYDLGARTRLAWGRLADLDAVVIEANHDLQMLRNGPYPWHLKQRVASRHGHLSNADAALGVAELLSDRLRKVVLYHLSRTNNAPALAVQAVGAELDANGSAAELVVTAQDEATPWLELEPHGQLSLAW